MKVTVWTSWGRNSPKCIFNGDIEITPKVGDMIVVRDGFCCETVKSVTYDFVKKEVEISIVGSDDKKEYGDCLLK